MIDKYLTLLNSSYDFAMEISCLEEYTRLAYIGDEIFDFCTYDDSASELFAEKAVEVCVAITNQASLKYISNNDNYHWYLIIVNMPFMQNKLDWGTSIRGAWWNTDPEFVFELNPYAFRDANGEPLKISWDLQSWPLFIKALADFASQESI